MACDAQHYPTINGVTLIDCDIIHTGVLPSHQYVGHI